MGKEVARKRLFTRDFTLVVAGQVISLFGNAILRFALPLFLLDQTGSAFLFGTVTACSFLPMILLSPIGGIIADRVNKRNIMVVLDFATAGLVTVFFLLLGFAPLVPLLIVTLMLLYGIQGAYQPSVQASLPALMEQGRLMAGNAVINQVSSLAGLIGPAIGGVLYKAWGIKPILAVSMVCFLCSAIMELFIHIPFERREETKGMWEIAKGDMRDSIRFIRFDQPTLGGVIGVIIAINLFLSAFLMVGLPVLVTQKIPLPDGLSDQLYGYAQGILAAGGLCGGLLAGLLGKWIKLENSCPVFLGIAAAIVPVGLVLLFGLPAMASYIILVGCCFIVMLLCSLLNIQMIAYVQSVTPSNMVGKIISCLVALSLSAQPVGQVLYGTLFELLPDSPWLILFFVAAAGGCIAFASRQAFSKLALD